MIGYLLCAVPSEVPGDQGNAECAEPVKSQLLGLDEFSPSTPQLYYDKTVSS